jgi:hypothetical protein
VTELVGDDQRAERHDECEQGVDQMHAMSLRRVFRGPSRCPSRRGCARDGI